ncbi:MAG: putative metal-binding motif-containing protein, partial [Myxococcota bacterium]|nr:putative metal-binding motif-containing protein [Myxococcota bacterium]
MNGHFCTLLLLFFTACHTSKDLADNDVDGQTVANGDCDDTNASVYSGADETCNGIDNNCSGDESDATDILTWYADADGDTFGNAEIQIEACEPPSAYVDNMNDCNDTEPLAWSDAEEI